MAIDPTLASIATPLITGLIAYFTLRGKNADGFKSKRIDEDAEFRREYINSLKSEIESYRQDIKEKNIEIGKRDEIIRNITTELHAVTVKFATLEVQYKNSSDDLIAAMRELDEFKKKVNTVLENNK